jgi:hypothetical protein
MILFEKNAYFFIKKFPSKGTFRSSGVDRSTKSTIVTPLVGFEFLRTDNTSDTVIFII